ncbi:hypothetical protein SBP28_002197 [Candidozyma auris]
MPSGDTNIRKISYILQMLGKNRKGSHSSYESLIHRNVCDTIETMLATPPIAEDNYLCETTASQKQVESTIKPIYEGLFQGIHPGEVYDQEIATDSHLKFLEYFMDNALPEPFYRLDASQQWLIYWISNAHVVLSGNDLSEDMKKKISQKVNALIVEEGKGGIAGGPNGQIGHVASTYAAVLSLILAEDYGTLVRIKDNMLQWLFTLKNKDGSFAMHPGGESDTRSTYCVLVISSLLDLPTQELWQGCREWLSSCQTFEGGFAGVPGTEAHGGYTFCALASFFLLGRRDGDFDRSSLLRWLADRQLSLEGGFSGRTNKLVDVCYSFWVGASFALMEADTSESALFNKQALISYIANCSQEADGGGLRDKPGKSPDLYHTNYALCGMSMAEHSYKNINGDAYTFEAHELHEGSSYTLPVSPVFGIPLRYVEKYRAHIQKK